MSQHSDDLIERCAKALCDNTDEIPGFWDELDARGKEEFRALARAVLDEAAKPAPGGPKMREGWDDDDLAELKRMVPDLLSVLTQNPIHQVYFRAGLLACREYMARFVEQGGDAVTAGSIRANWWPSLGDDPGPPRLFDFAELVDETGPGYRCKPISPSVEALPRAKQFLDTPPEPTVPEVLARVDGEGK